MNDLSDEEFDQLLRRAAASVLESLRAVIDPEQSLVDLHRRIKEQEEG